MKHPMSSPLASLAKATVLAGVLGACISVALAATPKEQQAIVQNGNGGADILKLQTVPVLQPAANQVLIKVYAAAVNPVDWKMRAGMGGPPPGAAGAGGPPGGGPPGAGGPPPGGAGGPPGAGAPPPGGRAASGPSIPGLDVAGVVEQVGPGVTTVKVGDPVFSMIGRSVTGLNGGYAEYVVAPAENAIAKPKKMTYAEAAGLGTAATTGVRSVNQANVSKGQRVLITGVAGGVGSAAAQAAKAKGAYVIGTASAKHNAYLKSLGVDEVIDYTQGKFEDKVKNVDVVIDTVGSDTAERALTTLKKGGTFVSVAARGINDKCTAAGVNCPAGAPMGGGDGGILSEVGKLASEGKLTVSIDQTFPLAKAGEAQTYGEQGHTQGKIILLVNSTEANKK